MSPPSNSTFQPPELQDQLLKFSCPRTRQTACSPVFATAQEIQEAIEEYLPEAEEGDGYIDFDQVTTLYTNLMQGWGGTGCWVLSLCITHQRGVRILFIWALMCVTSGGNSAS